MAKTFTTPLYKAVLAADVVYIEHDSKWIKMIDTDLPGLVEMCNDVASGEKTIILGSLRFKTTTKKIEDARRIHLALNCSAIITIDNKGIATIPSSIINNFTVETVAGFTRDNTIPVKLKFAMLRECCMNFADTKKIN